MKHEHTLEIVMSYTIDGRIKGATWQWRNGRCTRNGASANEVEAALAADKAFDEWAATHARVEVPA